MNDDLLIWNGSYVAEHLEIRFTNIVIVGNGPVVPEDNEHIEEADIVIRFNNWGSRSGLREEQNYVNGRCDMVLLSGDVHTTNIGKDTISMPHTAIQCIPYPHNKNNIIKNMNKFYPTADKCILNPYWYGNSCEALGIDHDGLKHPGMPTVGFSALYHLYRMDLNRAGFYVTGFDFRYDLEKDTVNGYAVHSIPEIQNHYFLREALWVRNVIGRNQNWEFSPIINQVFDRIKAI